MVKKDYLCRLNEYLNHQIPELIFQLLKRTGYDTPISIHTINFEVISEIENYVNSDNGNSILEYLKSKNYPNTTPFAFLPGHKAFFLGLKLKSEDFDIFEAEDNNKNQKSNIQAENQRVGHYEEANEEANQEIETTLRKKIEKFVKNKKIPVENFENINLDVADFVNDKNRNKKKIVKCTVKCLFCEVRIPCIYASHWQISNYENHLKGHTVGSSRNEKSNGQSSSQSTQKTGNSENVNSSKEHKEKTLNDAVKNNTAIASENIEKSTVTDKIGENSNMRISINRNAQMKIDDVLRLDGLNISN